MDTESYLKFLSFFAARFENHSDAQVKKVATTFGFKRSQRPDTLYMYNVHMYNVHMFLFSHSILTFITTIFNNHYADTGKVALPPPLCQGQLFSK